jgi:hypothetical protein
VSKRTDPPGAGSVRAGAYTALSTLLVSGVAGVVGIVIAREFGRSDETDGLLAAYGVFIVVTIAAQAMRIAVLPQLARAWDEGRLAGEMAADALALALFAVPLILAAELGAQPFAELLTGGSAVAKDTAADVLRWVVPAATAYLFAGLAASGLAARNDYGTAALGYAAGSVAGLTLILLRVDEDGVIAVAWGMALNGAIALLVPVAALTVRALRARMPSGALRPRSTKLRARLRSYGTSAALPLGLQLLYVVCLAFAGRLGTGAATTFVYAYLAGASLVTITAGSLGLVTSVPLTRAGLDPRLTGRHVAATSWLSLVFIGAAAGIFALVGGDLVERVLGSSYGGEVGAELGRLVVLLAPWMVVSVGVAVAFPLAFVAGRTRLLPLVALAALAFQVPSAWLGAELFELDGLAVALTASTSLVLVGLLAMLGALGASVPDLLVAALVVGAVAVLTFGVSALVLGPVAGALAGLAAYVAVLGAARPRGLRSSWRYLRGL